jgi:hypothetical protein
MPVEKGWIATKTAPDPVEVELAGTTTVEFGNLCIGSGGGLTLGFWSNKNGEKLFNNTSGSLTEMQNLNLKSVDKQGKSIEFNPKTYSEFKSWIIAANAINMDYMLSAQLAAMKLNVLSDKVTGSNYIWDKENSKGIEVNDLIDKANAALNDSTMSRTDKEHLKNLLDRANNNTNFILPLQSAPYTFAVTP